MRDAFGGIMNITLIAIFLVIVSGILGLTVNYTKAFRMKNLVISALEQYEGYGCFNDTLSSTACKVKVKQSAESIGYHPVDINCGAGYTLDSNRVFCYKESTSKNNNKYYSVITQVDINIPIINKIMGLSFFQIHGDTRVIKK